MPPKRPAQRRTTNRLVSPALMHRQRGLMSIREVNAGDASDSDESSSSSKSLDDEDLTNGRSKTSLDEIDRIAKMSMVGEGGGSPVQKFGKRAKIDKFGSFDENEEPAEARDEEKKEEPSQEQPQAPNNNSSNNNEPDSRVDSNTHNSGAEEEKPETTPETEEEGEKEKEKGRENPTKPAPIERKGSIRLRSVRRESLDNNENEKLLAKKASQEHDGDDDSADDSVDGSDEDHGAGEGEEGSERRRSVSSSAAEVYRRNSYSQAIDTFHLSKYYQEAMLKAQRGGGERAKTWTPKQRWLNAIHTVLRGVRAVNAFLPQAYKKRKAERVAESKKKDAWHSVKKTAVQQAVQNRMAMEFKVDAVENAKSVGFAFGKSADRQLFENCLNILKMEHKKRSRPDVVMLLSLLKGNAFFSKLEYEVKLELASVMSLVSFKEGVNVFKQGDVGNLFFIVLNGEVDVFVTHMGIQFKACTYNVGGSFGERALLTSEPRAATVTCTEDSDFLIIGRRDYLRVLRDVHEREALQKIQFLKTVRYFDMLPSNICEEIAQKFHKKRYGRNEIVIRESDKHTHLHIIRTGECRVLKRVKLNGEVVFLETRHLSSRDFFGQEDKSVNQFSVLSLSFAEVYSCHVNDLKNIEHPELQKCIQDMKSFADKFDYYNEEETLKDVYKEQQKWEERKKGVMEDIMKYKHRNN
ncbi:hypothetical protein TrST_g5313 [Triparma strigata]|uniref:Cyclic nucleotide-binding domain-containing protein n=1 Tax=Triparma strigata TaxID=1606541 RepID=A0A9W7BPQ0_9STRA|nr:hypothetical protein TrST_g5313 [Triparma strigata]